MVDFIRDGRGRPERAGHQADALPGGPNSPIVEALLEAREAGKQVAVLVELKARFDEENNIEWARALEQAGVHVVYGLLGPEDPLPRWRWWCGSEGDGIRRYVHLGTGNYNPVTARLYTDMGAVHLPTPSSARTRRSCSTTLTGYSQPDHAIASCWWPRSTCAAACSR